MIVSAGTDADERCSRLEACYELLLPGIPDAITLDMIAPKLSWREVLGLSSVSRGWCHAIRSRAVYDARVRLQATETLLVLNYVTSGNSRQIALYSVKEGCYYNLPPTPHPGGRIPCTSQCISFDGRIYVLGGEFYPGVNEVPGNDKVYVLDLAGERQWKQCASMIKPRRNFGCGVVNGKIYVFGDLSSSEAVCGSEMYDPDQNTWSPIKAMTCMRFDHDVAGPKLLVHGGKVVEPRTAQWASLKETILLEDLLEVHAARGTYKYVKNSLWYKGRYNEKASCLEVSHAVKDQWAVVEAFRRENMGPGISYLANGKLHLMNHDDIYVHDIDTNSWTHLHSHRFKKTGLGNPRFIVLQTATAVDDQLLAIVEVIGRRGLVSGSYLLRSRGFGCTNKVIEWERAPFTFLFEERRYSVLFNHLVKSYVMHPIQL